MGDIYIIMNVSEKKAKDMIKNLEEVVIAVKNNKELSTSLISLMKRVKDDT